MLKRVNKTICHGRLSPLRQLVQIREVATLSTIKLKLHLFDFLWFVLQKKLYSKSTKKPQKIERMECALYALQQVVQQIHNMFIANLQQTLNFRQVLQLVVQQIHNKSNKQSSSIEASAISVNEFSLCCTFDIFYACA
jgi:hypothetical protein